jgi:biopolymer transport protein ExbD
MYRIPSSRKKKAKPQHLNLVPILDSFLTLMFFLLLSGTVMHYYKISSDVPIISTQSPPPTQHLPLNLTLQVRKESIAIFTGLPSAPYKTIPNIPRLIPSKVSKGVQPASVTSSVELSPTVHDLEALRVQLLELKKQTPSEHMLLLEVMDDEIAYEDIVKIMDIARQLRPTDAPIMNENKKEISLFEEIIFTNLKG